LSDNEIIVGLATIIVFGVGAQWIARRLDFPSILVLLPLGLAAGELGLVDPEQLFGDTLFPLVTMLVSLLLFQAGLQLRLAELPKIARAPVFRLVVIGGAITFVCASFAAHVILDLDNGLGWLIGAILVVSGPTVVGPLVAVLRPRAPIGSVLNWESTVLDPIGATLGVVVLNLVLASERGGLHPLLQMFGRLGLGIAVGLVAAIVMVYVFSRFLVTDEMEAAVALLFAVAAFAAAEVMLSEAGLFATVTLGVVAANQRLVPTTRIRGFGETLEVLIIGILFVLLGALVSLENLGDHAPELALLVAALVVLIRPLAVGLSLAGSHLSGRDRALVASIDPRGVVAAATAAQFTIPAVDAGLDADFLLPVVFGVILGTGIIYGLAARPIARRLQVLDQRPTGVAVVGDAEWLRGLARCLHTLGVPVLRLSTGSPGVALQEAEADGVATISLLDGSEHVDHAIAAARLSRAVVSTPGDVETTLLRARLVELVGRRHVYAVVDPAPGRRRLGAEVEAPAFAPGVYRADLDARVQAGAEVTVTPRGTKPPADALVLAAVRPDGSVNLAPGRRRVGANDALIAVVDEVRTV
jgi:NhaP-type Na+/H+ or K+/H+ antiporter